MWPQITIISLWSASFAINTIMHGKPKGDYNIYNSMFNIGLGIWIFNAGGFFNNLK